MNFSSSIIVNNFQALSAELVRKKEDLGKSVELENMKRELSAAILKHNEKQYVPLLGEWVLLFIIIVIGVLIQINGRTIYQKVIEKHVIFLITWRALCSI